MCCNEHLSVSPCVHVSVSVWCHSIGIHTARLRTEVYHGSVLLRGRSLVNGCPLCASPALDPLTVWQSEAKPSISLFWYARLCYWDGVFFTSYWLSVFLHSMYCLFSAFVHFCILFLTDLSRNSFGCFFPIVYIQCFIIYGALFLCMISCNPVLWLGTVSLKRSRLAFSLPASESSALESHPTSRP